MDVEYRKLFCFIEKGFVYDFFKENKTSIQQLYTVFLEIMANSNRKYAFAFLDVE